MLRVFDHQLKMKTTSSLFTLPFSHISLTLSLSLPFSLFTLSHTFLFVLLLVLSTSTSFSLFPSLEHSLLAVPSLVQTISHLYTISLFFSLSLTLKSKLNQTNNKVRADKEITILKTLAHTDEPKWKERKWHEVLLLMLGL